MVDVRNTKIGLALGRSRLRPLGVRAYVAYSRLSASGVTAPVFLNSIPKSGTHLMANILDAVPGLRFSGLHLATIDIGRGDNSVVDEARFSALHARIRRGQYFTGHVPFSTPLADHLAASETHVIFMYRHPFDVALSSVDFIEKRGNPIFRDLFFREATSHEKRIEFALFGGVDKVSGGWVPSVAEQLARHEGWLTSENVISVRFEDLRGSPAVARSTLGRLITAIGVDIEPDRLLAAAGHRRSATMNRGEAGRWQAEMPRALAERAQAEFAPVLARWGFTS